jgi:hypothetical protein
MKGKRNVVERKAERGGVEDGKGERKCVWSGELCLDFSLSESYFYHFGLNETI